MRVKPTRLTFVASRHKRSVNQSRHICLHPNTNRILASVRLCFLVLAASFQLGDSVSASCGEANDVLAPSLGEIPRPRSPGRCLLIKHSAYVRLRVPRPDGVRRRIKKLRKTFPSLIAPLLTNQVPGIMRAYIFDGAP